MPSRPGKKRVPLLSDTPYPHVVLEQVCDKTGHFTVYAAHVRRLAPMPSLHSQSCKILSCLGAYYSQVQAGPAHNCLPVAIMFRNQLTNCDHLFTRLLFICSCFRLLTFHSLQDYTSVPDPCLLPQHGSTGIRIDCYLLAICILFLLTFQFCSG